MKHYRLWAFEHRQWWRADRQGYTSNSREAGRYSEDDAREIVENAMGDEVAIVAEPLYGEPRSEGPDVIVFDLRTVLALNP